jgi:hypothetical protein
MKTLECIDPCGDESGCEESLGREERNFVCSTLLSPFYDQDRMLVHVSSIPPGNRDIGACARIIAMLLIDRGSKREDESIWKEQIGHSWLLRI